MFFLFWSILPVEPTHAPSFQPTPVPTAEPSTASPTGTIYLTKVAPSYSFFEWIWPLPFCHLTFNFLLPFLALYIVFASSSMYLMPYPMYLHVFRLRYTICRILSPAYHTTCSLWCLPCTVCGGLTAASRIPVTGQPSSRPSGLPSSRPTQAPTNLVYQKIAVNLYQVHNLSMIFYAFDSVYDVCGCVYIHVSSKLE